MRSKPPWSARSKKIGKVIQSSSPFSSRPVVQNADSTHVPQTPARSRYTTVENTPIAPRFSQDPAARNQKNPPKLPGFSNAFETSTPHRASQPGKGKARDAGLFQRVSSKNNLFLQNQVQLSDDAQPFSSPPSSPLQDRIAARASKYGKDDADPFGQGEAMIQSIRPQQNLSQYRDPPEEDLSDDEEAQGLQLLDKITEV